MITSALVAGWVASSALVMVLTDAAPGAWVILPGDRLLANLPGAAAITGAGDWTVTLKSEPGLTRDLYAAGAWLVLPAGLTGCLRRPAV